MDKNVLIVSFFPYSYLCNNAIIYSSKAIGTAIIDSVNPKGMMVFFICLFSPFIIPLGYSSVFTIFFYEHL